MWQKLVILAVESLIKALYTLGIVPLVQRIRIERSLKAYGLKAENAAKRLEAAKTKKEVIDAINELP
jgi:hypothetical protein